MTDGPKLPFILRVRLDAQTGREDELAHRGAEAGEEGVEGLISQRTLAYPFCHSFMQFIPSSIILGVRNPPFLLALFSFSFFL